MINVTFEDVGFFSTDCSNAILHLESFNHATIDRCLWWRTGGAFRPVVGFGAGFEIGQPSITNAPLLTTIEFVNRGDNGCLVQNSIFQGGACSIYAANDYVHVVGNTFGGVGEWISNGVKHAHTGLDPNYDDRALARP